MVVEILATAIIGILCVIAGYAVGYKVGRAERQYSCKIRELRAADQE